MEDLWKYFSSKLIGKFEMHTVYTKGKFSPTEKDKVCDSELTKQGLWIRQNNIDVVWTMIMLLVLLIRFLLGTYCGHILNKFNDLWDLGRSGALHPTNDSHLDGCNCKRKVSICKPTSSSYKWIGQKLI